LNVRSTPNSPVRYLILLSLLLLLLPVAAAVEVVLIVTAVGGAWVGDKGDGAASGVSDRLLMGFSTHTFVCPTKRVYGVRDGRSMSAYQYPGVRVESEMSGQYQHIRSCVFSKYPA
jgi:hypothetical protein